LSRIRGVLFDLDGTLVDSIGCYWIAFDGGMSKFGLGPVSHERLAGYLDNGARMDQMFADLFPHLDAATVQACRAEVRNIYLKLEQERVVLFPGARELLAGLKSRGVKTGVATGRMSAGDNKYRELRRFGIDHLIDVVVTGADAKPKPAPDTVSQCVRRLGLVPPECVFVGDSASDIVAARAAGLAAFAVTTGVGSRASLQVEKPLAVLDGIGQLMVHLEPLLDVSGHSVGLSA
jgi:phosphoglycolate phosphatase